ncbi:hypothetical protein Pmani_029605 [Petrolisthes manimaculis]|uniref:Uncharacterized protein n=1 Tax=Petrolisthes manimaculis TaxID=1843537 RepID=A0AAE1NZN4_9EUCA|nr:hypothetical protein Pmani_029605 [Petrolisthes manimaculis]
MSWWLVVVHGWSDGEGRMVRCSCGGRGGGGGGGVERARRSYGHPEGRGGGGYRSGVVDELKGVVVVVVEVEWGGGVGRVRR